MEEVHSPKVNVQINDSPGSKNKENDLISLGNNEIETERNKLVTTDRSKQILASNETLNQYLNNNSEREKEEVHGGQILTSTMQEKN